MNRLKGTLNLYKKIDVLYVFAPIIIASIGPFLTILENKKMNIKITNFIMYTVAMILLDSIYSFCHKYIVYKNFNSSKRLFFESQKILILIKSVLNAIIGCLYFVCLFEICKIKNISYTIELLGREYRSITSSYLIITFVIIFIYVLTMYCIGILISIINKTWIMNFLMMSSVIIMSIISDIFFNTKIDVFYYFIILCSFILLSISSMKLSWYIFKKKDIEISDIYKSIEK